MPDGNAHSEPPPTSEVGSGRANETRNSATENDVPWRQILEAQNEQMRALIEALRRPPTTNSRVVFPDFDPEKQDINALSWCTTADVCMADAPLEGSQLIVAISKALKGAASTWLSQIAYTGITWSQFKELFVARFATNETLAATLINLGTDKPAEKETYGAYASRVMSSLMSRFKNIDTERIMVSIVLAHLAQIDTRLQRLAFTTEITSRTELQKELQAFSYLKRKALIYDDKRSDNIKRPRLPTTPIKCFICGKLGHKQADCRLRNKEIKKMPLPVTTPTRTSPQPSTSGSVVCFKCGAPGHIASRCTSSSAPAPPTERRVNMCAVEPPTGSLHHLG
ncbi:uncharacterized protein [Choristoneura fumiferana]|uniref:uncharacterized protein n=1 Tax=Choristoneura fumiferana TaxID=7141 RepID=UPI003D15C29D